MKKLLKILAYPKALLSLGILFFIIGFLDVELNGASNISEMTWWGKTSVYGIFGIFGMLIIGFVIMPLFNKIFKK